MPSAIISPGDVSTTARFLFDLYTGPDAVAKILAIPDQTSAEAETNWLEFKNGDVRSEHLKQLWSKALGSFANSGGGVVIWGIQADRDPATGIDVARAVAPVPDVDWLATKLREYQPPATDAPIKGVVIQPLLLPGQAKKGFVVCLIPESDSKPHRSEFGKNNVKRFNIRIGDSTQECPLPILRQLFYPKYAPKLSVTLEAVDRIHSKGASFYTRQTLSVHLYKFTLHNIGSVTLYEATVYVHCKPHTIYKDLEGAILYPFEGESLDRGLHPDQMFIRDIVIYSDHERDVEWEIVVYARDIQPQRATIRNLAVIFVPWQPETVVCE